MTDDRPADLVYEQKVDLPYRYTAGPVHRAFLLAMSEKRLVASHNGGDRYVPARPFAPDGSRLDETEQVAAEGELICSTVAHHLPGAPTFGLILIDGAARPMLHRLDEGAEKLSAGSRVEAVWAEEPEPSILAISYFRPLQ